SAFRRTLQLSAGTCLAPLRSMQRAGLAIAVACGLAWAQAAPDPYQVRTVCTAAPVSSGRRVEVASGADLQRALDGAVAGDTIVLTPGATYRATSADGSFTLRNRGVPAGQWIVIRSADASFDLRGKLGPGIRVTDANASAMPQIRATRNAPAIRAESGARGYRLIGLDVGADPGVQQVVNMIELGDATQKT